MRYNYNTFRSPGFATSNPISTTGYTAYVNDAAQDHDALVHWTHIVNPTMLLDTHVFYSRNNDQTSPSGLVPAGFSPNVKLTVPSAFAIGHTRSMIFANMNGVSVSTSALRKVVTLWTSAATSNTTAMSQPHTPATKASTHFRARPHSRWDKTVSTHRVQVRQSTASVSRHTVFTLAILTRSLQN